MRIARMAAIIICLATVAVSQAMAEGTAASKQQDGWLSFDKDLAQAGAKDASAGETRESHVAAGSTEEAQASPLEKPWEIKFKAYGWMPTYHGRAGARGRTTRVDSTFDDLLHSIDEITTMVPVNVEARVGRWGLIVDLFYIRFEDSMRQGSVRAKIRGEQEILELAGFYRVGTWPVGTTAGKIAVDALAGARYNRLQGNIGLQAPQAAISVGGTQEWWDPFVGPRVTWQATEKLNLFVRGDVGGFGLENCSHFAWQIVAAAQYDITKNIFVEAGYRLLDTDYETGSGADKFVYDLQMRGPYMAFGVKF